MPNCPYGIFAKTHGITDNLVIFGYPTGCEGTMPNCPYGIFAETHGITDNLVIFGYPTV